MMICYIILDATHFTLFFLIFYRQNSYQLVDKMIHGSIHNENNCSLQPLMQVHSCRYIYAHVWSTYTHIVYIHICKHIQYGCALHVQRYFIQDCCCRRDKPPAKAGPTPLSIMRSCSGTMHLASHFHQTPFDFWVGTGSFICIWNSCFIFMACIQEKQYCNSRQLVIFNKWLHKWPSFFWKFCVKLKMPGYIVFNQKCSYSNCHWCLVWIQLYMVLLIQSCIWSYSSVGKHHHIYSIESVNSVSVCVKVPVCPPDQTGSFQWTADLQWQQCRAVGLPCYPV